MDSANDRFSPELFIERLRLEQYNVRLVIDAYDMVDIEILSPDFVENQIAKDDDGRHVIKLGTGWRVVVNTQYHIKVWPEQSVLLGPDVLIGVQSNGWWHEKLDDDALLVEYTTLEDVYDLVKELSTLGPHYALADFTSFHSNTITAINRIRI